MHHCMWFAMSATFQGEMKMKVSLEELGFACYVPMKQKQRRRGNKILRVIEPAISNLIFVYATKDEIQEVKRKFPRLQYHTYFENGRNVPIVVPQRQMENFIKATSVEGQELTYLTLDEIDLKEGTRISVIGGPLDGVEGVFMKVKGSRAKRLVVQLQVLSVFVAVEVSPDLIKILD